MPQLVRRRCLVAELIGCLDDHESGAGDQVVGLEKPVNRGFRDKVAPGVRKPDGQFPGRQLRLLQGEIDDLPPDIIRDPVPHPARAAVAILKTGVAKGRKAIVPAIKGGLRNAQLVQSGPDAQVGLLDQADDLQLLGCGIPHSSSPPCPIMFFLRRRFSSESSATNSFKSRISWRRPLTSPEVAWRQVSPASRFLPASKNSFDQL